MHQHFSVCFIPTVYPCGTTVTSRVLDWTDRLSFSQTNILVLRLLQFPVAIKNKTHWMHKHEEKWNLKSEWNHKKKNQKKPQKKKNTQHTFVQQQRVTLSYLVQGWKAHCTQENKIVPERQLCCWLLILFGDRINVAPCCNSTVAILKSSQTELVHCWQCRAKPDKWSCNIQQPHLSFVSIQMYFTYPPQYL